MRPVGTRVRLTEAAARNGRVKRPDRIGTVVGGRKLDNVLWDGNKNPVDYDPRSLEEVTYGNASPIL